MIGSTYFDTRDVFYLGSVETTRDVFGETAAELLSREREEPRVDNRYSSIPHFCPITLSVSGNSTLDALGRRIA